MLPLLACRSVDILFLSHQHDVVLTTVISEPVSNVKNEFF